MNKMIFKIKGWMHKYGEIIRYLFIGGCTTLVSLVSKYLLLFTVLDADNALQLQLSVFISWVLSVLFAYVTNRLFVFKSDNRNIIKEMATFISSRVATLVLESGVLWFFITFLGFSSDMNVIIWSLVAQVLVIIVNYFLSKFLVFSKDGDQKLSKIRWFYVCIFIMLIAICYFFPYTHDDWAWGSNIGIERLSSLFKNYNGRWAGNLLVMALTRNRLLRTGVIALTFWCLFVLAKKLINSKRFYVSCSLIILLCLMPIPVLAQSIAWTSGFANYVMPSLITIFILYLNRDIFNNNEIKLRNLWIIPFLLLGFVGALFVEHMTIYCVLFALFLLVVTYRRNKHIVWPNLSFMIGTVMGTVLMFSNSGYSDVMNASDTYRTIEKGNILVRALKTYFGDYKDMLVNDNVIINILIIISLLLLLYNFYKNKKKNFSKLQDILLKCSSLILVGYLTYISFIMIMGHNNPFVLSKLQNVFEGCLIIAYAFAIIVVCSLTIKDISRKRRVLFEIISIIVIALPLLIVTPIGPRCFFPSYFLFAILTCELLDEVFAKQKVNIDYLLKFSTISVMASLVCIYGYSFKVETERINYVNDHKDVKGELLLPNLPNANYMQGANPASDTFKKRFKLFYGIDDEAEIVLVPYKSWKKQR